MNAQPTQGPWGIEQTDENNWIGPMRPDGRKVSEIVCHTDREGLNVSALNRNDANARLIAAAPDLLAACKRLEAVVEMVRTENRNLFIMLKKDHEIISAVIRKAKGEA